MGEVQGSHYLEAAISSEPLRTRSHLFCHRIGKRDNQAVSLSASSPSNKNSNIDDADADLDDADADLDDDQIVLLPLKSAANKDNIQSPPPNPIPSQSSTFATPFLCQTFNNVSASLKNIYHRILNWI